MIHTLVSVPIAFIVNIIVARILGVVDYGRMAYLTTIMQVAVGLISMGVGVGELQFGAKAHAAGDTGQVQRILSKSQGFRLLVQAPVITAVVLLVAHVDPWLALVAIAFGVWVPAMLDGAATCLGIENKTAAGAKNAMVINVLTQIAVLAAAFAVGTADSVWAARLAMGGLTATFALLWIAPHYRRAALRPSLPVGFPEGFWRFAIPAGLAAAVSNLVVSRTEVLGLSWLGEPVGAGIFALAFGLAGHLFSPAQALIGPLVPAISGLSAIDAGSLKSAFYRTMRGTSTVISLMVAVGMPVLAILIPVIYGAEYTASSPVFMALGLGGAVMVLAGPVSAFVHARLSGWKLLRVSLLALALDVALMVALIPLWGVWGAVAANLAAALSRLAMLLRLELASLGVSWRTLLASVAPLQIGMLASLVAWLAASRIQNPWLATAVAGVLGLLLLGVGVRAARSGLTEGDVVAVARALPARTRNVGSVLLRALAHSRHDL